MGILAHMNYEQCDSCEPTFSDCGASIGQLLPWPRQRSFFAAVVMAMVMFGLNSGGAAELQPGWNKGIVEQDTTWDCFLPTIYASSPQSRFPVLFTSSPGGNPGAHGLEAWAERRGVIVVAINDSRNGPVENNIHAQALVWEAAEKQLRLHPCLRYAMGQSGGGAASVALVKKHPDQFAGVLVNVHSAGGLPKHVAAVYVGGLTDTTHPCSAVRGTAMALTAAGNSVWYIEDPGTHDTAVHSGERAEPLMDWLLFGTCMSHPKLDAASRTEGAARISKELTDIAALTDHPAQITRYESLMRLPALLADKTVGRQLINGWSDAQMQSIDPAQAVATHTALTLFTENKQFPLVEPKRRQEVTKTLEALRKVEPSKGEWAGWQMLRSIQATEKKAGAAKGALVDVVKGYQVITTKWPTTKAGEEATAALERLKAKLEAMK